MSDVDLSEFVKLSKPKKARCPLEPVLGALTKEELVQLNAALTADNTVIGAGAIVQWLLRRDHKVNHQHVVSHRKQTCTCHA